MKKKIEPIQDFSFGCVTDEASGIQIIGFGNEESLVHVVEKINEIIERLNDENNKD